jgi:hypothetical protein
MSRAWEGRALSAAICLVTALVWSCWYYYFFVYDGPWPETPPRTLESIARELDELDTMMLVWE